MKKKITLIILLISWVVPKLSKAQCAVTTNSDADRIGFYGERLLISSDKRESIGFLLALSVGIVVDKKTAGYTSHVQLQLIKLSSKPLHYPNYVKFEFANGKTLEFYSKENDILTKDEGGVKYNQVVFGLKEGGLGAFQKIPLIMITISDAATYQIKINKSQSQGIMIETNCVMKKAGLE